MELTRENLKNTLVGKEVEVRELVKKDHSYKYMKGQITDVEYNSNDPLQTLLTISYTYRKQPRVKKIGICTEGDLYRSSDVKTNFGEFIEDHRRTYSEFGNRVSHEDFMNNIYTSTNLRRYSFRISPDEQLFLNPDESKGRGSSRKTSNRTGSVNLKDKER